LILLLMVRGTGLSNNKLIALVSPMVLRLILFASGVI
jgi:hypothetical protein